MFNLTYNLIENLNFDDTVVLSDSKCDAKGYKFDPVTFKVSKETTNIGIAVYKFPSFSKGISTVEKEGRIGKVVILPNGDSQASIVLLERFRDPNFYAMSSYMMLYSLQIESSLINIGFKKDYLAIPSNISKSDIVPRKKNWSKYDEFMADCKEKDICINYNSIFVRTGYGCGEYVVKRYFRTEKLMKANIPEMIIITFIK
jgi:hypothetical protein